MLQRLFTIIQDRKRNPQPGSYTNQLMEQGEDQILKKVGEEAMEIILAAKSQGNKRIVEESADLVYHLFVLLESRGISLADVEAELERRHVNKGVS